jgi:hypothetical protein
MNLIFCLSGDWDGRFEAKAVRGGFAKLCGQAANLALRLGFLAIMARLLLWISGHGYRGYGSLEPIYLPVKPARDFSSPTWRCFR